MKIRGLYGGFAPRGQSAPGVVAAPLEIRSANSPIGSVDLFIATAKV
jgi:hypothetical protein